MLNHLCLDPNRQKQQALNFINSKPEWPDTFNPKPRNLIPPRFEPGPFQPGVLLCLLCILLWSFCVYKEPAVQVVQDSDSTIP